MANGDRYAALRAAARDCLSGSPIWNEHQRSICTLLDERDELLAALQLIADGFSHKAIRAKAFFIPDDSAATAEIRHPADVVRAAIAKATGGAS